MSVIEITDWATSAGQKKIPLYKSASDMHKPIILIGGVHGDEPEGVELATQTLHWLKQNCEKKVTLAPWVVIPCLNPDGIAKNERTNGNGVDLNRNYPSSNWSTTASQPRYNPGPAPASEPEIKALVKLIDQTSPRLIIHCHSWQPCIVYTGERGRTDAEALARSSGYELRTDIGYPTTGSLSQYAWHDLKIPVICIEEQEQIALEKVWPHFASGMKAVFTNLSLRQDEV